MKSLGKRILSFTLALATALAFIPELVIPALGQTDPAGGSTGPTSALTGDFAYISAFYVDHIEDGIGNFDTPDNIAQVTDSSGNLQTVESPGNDASGSNGKVRTYDSIRYFLNYEAAVYGGENTIESGVAYFRFELPLSPEEAEWDLDAMKWMQNTDVTVENSGGICRQVLTGERFMVPGDGDTNVFPGFGQWSAVVKVLRMKNGEQITPTFSAWLEHNCTTGICPEHGVNEVQTVTTDDCPITVTCAPKYNIQVIAGASVNAKGEFDFSTGNSSAMDRQAGTVTGRIRSFGITLQLCNDRRDKGLMGLEFPSGDITFDLNLSVAAQITSGATPEETDVTDLFAPLVWGFGPQEKADTDTGGRNLRIHDITNHPVNAAPFNAGGTVVGTAGSESCKNGGSWSAVKEGNTLHVTVSGYEIDPQYFPNTNGSQGATSTTYYNAKTEGYKGVANIGCFSAGKVFVVAPFSAVDGRPVNEVFPEEGSVTFLLRLSDSNLMADGLSASSGTANQVRRDDDIATAEALAGTSPGSFSQYVLWSTRDAVAIRDVFNGLQYHNNGQDWQLEGGQIAITWGAANAENDEHENRAIASRYLMKFDPAGVELTGEIAYNHLANTVTRTILFAAKKNGSTWVSDDEMVAASMEDLVYYQSLSDLEAAGKICVGILLEIDPRVAPDKVEKITTNLASAYVTVKEGAARRATYMVTAESRVWRYSEYIASSAFAVPSLLGNDPDAPIVLPEASDEVHHGYAKTLYRLPGGYAGGHSGTYDSGDSLLVIAVKATIRNQTAQISENAEGVDEPKIKYDLDYYERTADYVLTVGLTDFVGSDGMETVKSSGTSVTVTVQDTLPAGLHYISGSAFYGGTYTQNASAGTRGTVTGGVQTDPEISVDPVSGAETLTWVLENVSVDGDVPPLYFSAFIGNPNDETSDVKNGDRLMNTATVRATGDYRDLTEFNGNVSGKEIAIVKLYAASLSKTPDEEYADATADGRIGYTLTQSNIASSQMESLVLDTLPFDGDTFGSAFAGNYAVEAFQINKNTDNIAGWTVYYTTDVAARGTYASDYRKEDIRSGSSAIGGNTVTWTQVTVDADGNVPGLRGTTPTAIAVICTISGNKSFQAHLLLKKDLNANERFVNSLSVGGVRTQAKVEVIGRTLEGCLWIDADRSGSRESAEELPAGITASLLVLDPGTGEYVPVLQNGLPVTCAPGYIVNVTSDGIAEGEAGHYMFTCVPAGTYAVRFEGTSLDFSDFAASEKNKTGVSELFNSNADGIYEDGYLQYTQIGGIVLKTNEQIVAEGGTALQLSAHNDSGICRLSGGLTVSKTVSSAIADPDASFVFTVTLGDSSITGTYGEMMFSGGIAVLALKDGESITAVNLPAGISYTVAEADASAEGYTAVSSGANGTVPSGRNAEAAFTNIRNQEYIDVSVTKTWEDNDNQDGRRPAFVTVHLLADGIAVDSAVLDEENGWSFTFAGVEKYRNGNVISYDIREDEPAEYSARITSSANGSNYAFTVENCHDPEKVRFTVLKVWDDDGNKDGIRPASVTVRLYADGVEADFVILNERNDWSFTFAGFDKYRNGTAIVYDIREDAVDGYETVVTSSANGDAVAYTVENRHAGELTRIDVRKVWEDDGNRDGIRPASVGVLLLADGEDTGKSLILSAENNWMSSFTDLPVYRGQGIRIAYSVREAAVAGYMGTVTATGGGFILENTHIPATTRVPVTKIWDDEENADGIRPAEITVFLLADGAETGKAVILSSGNAWTGAFENLPVNKDGKPVVYTVREIAAEGYSSSVTGNAAEGYTVCNTHVVKKYGNLMITKTVAGEDGKSERSFGFEVIFGAEGEYEYRGTFGGADVAGTVRSGASFRMMHGDWLEIIGLPEKTEYSVKETENGGYSVQAEGAVGVILPGTSVYAAFTNVPEDIPETGDRFFFWYLLGGFSLTAGAAILFRKKKEE